MDYSFWSAVVDGLIFLVVLGMAARIYMVKGMMENVEEIIVEWNNKAVAFSEAIEEAQEEAVMDFIANQNSETIREWDNA
jgi:hypothetical protein